MGEDYKKTFTAEAVKKLFKICDSNGLFCPTNRPKLIDKLTTLNFHSKPVKQEARLSFNYVVDT